jgi:hypothetical protein
MQVGDLVRTTRSLVGVPKGTLALVLGSREPRGTYADGTGHKMLMLQVAASSPRKIQILSRDLEVVSGDR